MQISASSVVFAGLTSHVSLELHPREVGEHAVRHVRAHCGAAEEDKIQQASLMVKLIWRKSQVSTQLEGNVLVQASASSELAA